MKSAFRLFEQIRDINNGNYSDDTNAAVEIELDCPLRFAPSVNFWNSNKRQRHRQRELEAQGKVVTLPGLLHEITRESDNDNTAFTVKVVCSGNALLKHLSPADTSMLFKGLGLIKNLVCFDIALGSRSASYSLTIRALESALNGAVSLQKLRVGSDLKLCGSNLSEVVGLASVFATKQHLCELSWGAAIKIPGNSTVSLDPIVEACKHLSVFFYCTFRHGYSRHSISAATLYELCCRIHTLEWINETTELQKCFKLMVQQGQESKVTLREIYVSTERNYVELRPLTFADLLNLCKSPRVPLSKVGWRFDTRYEVEDGAYQSVLQALQTNFNEGENGIFAQPSNLEIVLNVMDVSSAEFTSREQQICIDIVNKYPNITLDCYPRQKLLLGDNQLSTIHTYYTWETVRRLQPYYRQHIDCGNHCCGNYKRMKGFDGDIQSLLSAIINVQASDPSTSVRLDEDNIALTCIFILLTQSNPGIFIRNT